MRDRGKKSPEKASKGNLITCQERKEVPRLRPRGVLRFYSLNSLAEIRTLQ
jgi:hypothetical protein